VDATNPWYKRRSWKVVAIVFVVVLVDGIDKCIHHEADRSDAQDARRESMHHVEEPAGEGVVSLETCGRTERASHPKLSRRLERF